jgi:hypothetical protein
MKKIRQHFCPRLYRIKWLINSMAIFFMLALSASLVSLPFASKQNRTVILNSVEEEAGNSNAFNEEHKSGKSIHCQFLDFCAYMQLGNKELEKYNFPRSVDILSSLHSKKDIQPPDC